MKNNMLAQPFFFLRALVFQGFLLGTWKLAGRETLGLEEQPFVIPVAIQRVLLKYCQFHTLFPKGN